MTPAYTNRFGWAPELVTAIMKDRYTDEDEPGFDFSASTLVAPVQLTTLKKRYPEKQAVEDVSQMMWRFIGSVAHSVLEEAWHDQANGEGDFVEKRLYMEVAGKTISGKNDLYSAATQEIRDYKSTKVYKIMRGDYEEWEKQLNIYGRLISLNGYPVKKLTIIPLIFDFKESETYKKGYPQSASGEIPLKLWTPEQQQAYIEQRVQMLITAEHLSDEDLTKQFPCSDKEMWQDVRDFAIMKTGQARAVAAGFGSEGEAAVAFREKNLSYATHSIVKRMSGRTRCAKWCPMRGICLQNRRLSIEEGNPLPADLSPCIF